MTRYLGYYFRALIALTSLSLASCGGRSGDLGITDGTAGAGFSASPSSGGSGTTTSAGSGGSGSPVGMGGSTASPNTCFVSDAGFVSFDTCGSLDRLVVRDPVLNSPSGHATPGGTATLTVTLADASGLGYDLYPGVLFQSSDAGIALDNGGQSFNAYAILACRSTTGSVTIHIAASVAPGTVVHVTALAASVNENCPNAPRLVIPITVG